MLIRHVNYEMISQVESALQSRVVNELIARGEIIPTREIDRARAVQETSLTEWESAAGLFLQHERVPFASFPYEWTAGMLHNVGMLVLSLAEKLFEGGLGISHASPFAFRFRGARPVLVDFEAIQPRKPNDPLWLPLPEFINTFINPLLVQKYLGGDLAKIYLSSPAGLTSAQVYQLIGPVRRWFPPFLSLVTGPTWLEKMCGDKARYRAKDYEARNPAHAKAIFLTTIRYLRHKLEMLTPRVESSSWYSYRLNNPYTAVEMCEKKCAVEEILSSLPAGRMIDIGCSTGQYSFMAAEKKWSVVAVDSDPAVIGELWKRAYVTYADILPLVQNMSQPSPWVGWMNDERESFLARAKGSFDLVTMLAVVHHLLDGKIGMESLIQMAAQLTRKHWLVEFVLPEDPSFAQLHHHREGAFADLSFEQFERRSSPYFEIVSKRELIPNQRRLYLMRKRA